MQTRHNPPCTHTHTKTVVIGQFVLPVGKMAMAEIRVIFGYKLATMGYEQKSRHGFENITKWTTTTARNQPANTAITTATTTGGYVRSVGVISVQMLIFTTYINNSESYIC